MYMLLKLRLMKGALWLAPALLLAAQPVLAEQPRPAEQAAAKPAPVVQDYEPRPALWLLSDEDTKIYLFGTIHILPPGFKWRSPALDKVAREADTLVVETAGSADPAGEEALFMSLMLDEPAPVLKRVPKGKRRALKAALARSGLPLEALSMVPTWAVAMVLDMSGMLGSWGVSDLEEAPGVENGLETQFKAAKKPILSVEGPEAGFDALNALPEADQVAMLLDTIGGSGPDAPGGGGDEDKLWATGRPEEAYRVVMKDFPPMLYEGLVRKRNAAWTLWLEERLKTPGTALFAVGAAHLAGPDSVQTMLAARGLEAKRVD
jgi:uncharacterized protein YbaP (TraB family)